MVDNKEEDKDFFMTYRVGVKTPAFNADDPQLWFAQLEGQFVLSNITTDNTKFYYVLAQLEPQHSAQVRDLIVNPPSTGRYEKLKAELIKRLSASQERKIKQLLMHEELGDRKPTQFLRHLQQLAGPTVPTDFIRSIWCSRLPANLQTIVTMQANSSLEEVAELVDRINDIVPVTAQVAATSMPVPGQVASSQPATSQQSSAIEALTQTVAELSRKLEVMSSQLRHRSSRSRSGGRFNQNRHRSQSRTRDNRYCYYHSRFGDKARRCTEPCAYNKKALNHQGSH
ncbi:uncharacterized protein LOC113508121 [Trichoplusia ni]|uniref:Uncharacterized protein LOC113500812 n=1 Tax=Trichoplusia ni TaxID=7111 RepID=A0A7E5WKR4_TRINI|nr:uncharacterized protein LOC113500812 [Trichoplusia ni]XP_026741370.1 uncharacterized protein LOC113503539 [Trichoplusia ni]XP_026746895.1 uncharacterized protein LOC113508121 [Trichoplusia ni]